MSILTQNPKTGVYPFYSLPLKLNQIPLTLTYPQSFLQFPFELLAIMFLSSLCKLAMPFAMQNLYKSMGQNERYFFSIFSLFIMLIVVSYILERYAEKIMNQHKMEIRKILCQRVTKNLLITGSIGKQSLWTKISGNINIYVNNYYDSYVNLVFETFKTVSIIFYLLYKLGIMSFIGLFLCGCTVWLTLTLTKYIQKQTFANVKIREKKVGILTQYFQRIVDYQMSWLDLFIAERIKKLELQYHKNLTRSKMLDCCCVGLWQFTTIGISSAVLCCYYFYYGVEDKQFEPATIVYFFQMLTFPLNAISWHIAGIKNATQAILELSQAERSPISEEYKQLEHTEKGKGKTIKKTFEQQNAESQEKKNASQTIYRQITLNFGTNELKLAPNKFYGISSSNAQIFLQLCLNSTNKKDLVMSYANENSWFLPSIVETLLMTTEVQEKDFPKLNEASSLMFSLQADNIPFQNPVSTYSGGEKMRISLCRALLWGDIVFIDSDLKSLDPITRQKVLIFLRSLTTVGNFVADRKKYTIFIKDINCEIEDYIDQWIYQTPDKNWELKQNQKVKTVAQKQMIQEEQFRTLKVSKSSASIHQKKQEQIYLKTAVKDNKLGIEQNVDIDKSYLFISNVPQTTKTLSRRRSNDYSAQEKGQQFARISEISKRLRIIGNKIISNRKESKQGKEIVEDSSSQNRKFQRNGMKNNKQNNSKKIQEKKLEITSKTLLFYFKSSEHFLFFVFFVIMKIIGNYFTYFVNVTKPTNASDHTFTILQLASAHIIAIIFRSYFFSSANLKEAKRICLKGNDLTIFNHIKFYGHDKKNIQAENQEGEDENNEIQVQKSTTERLVCLTNSDQNTVSNQFPFNLNIFFNNLGTVVGAIVMVILQVPHMIVFIVVLYHLVIKIDQQYRDQNERLKIAEKDQEINFMRCVNYIEQGRDYIRIFRKEHIFYRQFEKQLSMVIAINNRTLSLGLWVKINYRLIMLAFMSIAIIMYWLINKGFQFFIATPDFGVQNVQIVSVVQKQRNFAGLAVMIRQIMSLTDYIFFFSLSLADSTAHAVSIQRIRKYAEDQDTVKKSNQRKEHCQIRLLKIKQNFNRYEKIKDGEGPVQPLVQFRKLKFSYSENMGEEVFRNLNMVIYPGDRILLKGKSGSGKTTLFKLITGLYPQKYFPTTTFHLLSFSSQHPLRIPSSSASIRQMIDPYNILHQVPFTVKKEVCSKMKPLLQKQKQSNLSYEDEVMMNNIRAYLYGYNGLAIYDEPMKILNEGLGTYLVVTHHREFLSKERYQLQGGKLIQDQGSQPNDKFSPRRKRNYHYLVWGKKR